MGDREQLHAIGHAILALVNAAILMAILAVILAPGSQVTGMINAFFSLLAWLVGQVIRPLTPAPLITLSSQLQPAGMYPLGGAGGTTGGSTGTTQSTPGGTGTAPAPTGTPGTGNAPIGTVVPLCDQTGKKTTAMGTVGYEYLFPEGLHACP